MGFPASLDACRHGTVTQNGRAEIVGRPLPFVLGDNGNDRFRFDHVAVMGPSRFVTADGDQGAACEPSQQPRSLEAPQ